jgi:hypothetical protein
MAEHEPSIGMSSDWYTPPGYFTKLGLTFDLDPASPGPGHWVPAKKIYTVEDDGLRQPWEGLVFLNPPFGGRNGQVHGWSSFSTMPTGSASCGPTQAPHGFTLTSCRRAISETFRRSGLERTPGSHRGADFGEGVSIQAPGR